MPPSWALGTALALTFLASPILAQSVITASATTTAGLSKMTSSTLKLAKSYTGSDFLSEFEFFTVADPTSGYVNYVSQADAQSLDLVAVMPDNSFVMRADAENKASGRGRNSVRINTKDRFADGVYIIDINHMPVGCGTWPAFWTVTKDGWPVGGEIDIVEGANASPTINSIAWNATSDAGMTTPMSGFPLVQDVASLHTSENCKLPGDTYMTGTIESTACSAYVSGNKGCGAELGGNMTYGVDSFGSGVNENNGGYYAMWRDLEKSGGVYVYYWPRGALNIPDDVKNLNTSTTNVESWGQPGANLSVPSCRSDFNNHVIVFDLTFCGDYAGATYAQSGCPMTCASFVQSTPKAFAEAYWSINSLRVYTASGKPAVGKPMSKGLISGVVVGIAALIVIFALLVWRYRTRRAARLAAGKDMVLEEDEAPKNVGWVGMASGSDLDSGDTLAVPALTGGKKGSFSSEPSSRGSFATGRGSIAIAPSSKSSFSLPPPTSSSTRASFSMTSTSTRASISAPSSSTASFAAPAPSNIPFAILPVTETEPDSEPEPEPGRGKKEFYNKKKGPTLIVSKKARTGRTVLKQGQTARHYLDGETRAGAYHEEAEGGTKARRQSAVATSSWVG